MFSNTLYKDKSKTFAASIIVFFYLSIVSIANAQSEMEHIHSAQAVLQQNVTFDNTTQLTAFTITTANDILQFELRSNSELLADTLSNVENIELFKGKITGRQDSWARFSRVNGVMSGAYFDGADLFLVKKIDQAHSFINQADISGLQSMQTSNSNPSVIINVKDIESGATCALHDDELIDKKLKIEQAAHAFNYNHYVDDLRTMMGTSPSKQIKISMFADKEFSNEYADPVSEMLSQLNIVDGIFGEQVGVQLLLTEAKALSSNNTLTSTDPLALIRAFRSAGLPNPGVSHLFTGKNLNGSTVGIAYVGSLCRTTSVGITQKYGAKMPIIFAHELGHNFGAPHDNQSGSACGSTSSGFVMNPNVDSGSSNFSACSLTQMQPTISFASTSSSACIVEISAQAPTITSTPSVSVDEGENYQYDSNNTVEASGTGPFTYALDIAPSQMRINANGTIMWTPTANDVGINTVQIRVSNNVGSDVQIFDITVNKVAAEEPYIDFSTADLTSFTSQDRYGSTDIGSSKYELTLTGNNWKKLPVNYEVTPNTVIQFDFASTIEGEIHGLGFVNDNRLDSRKIFNIFGKQTWWGQQAVKYDGSGQTRSITIAVGEFLQGKVDDLVFVMDNDVNNSTSNSVFSNVIIFEKGSEAAPPPPPPAPPLPEVGVIDFSQQVIQDYLPRLQDIKGTVELIEQGKGVKIAGNKWQKVALDSISITPRTVIEFEFKTNGIGEIHGLGFYEGNSLDRSKTLQVAGTQSYGRMLENYTGAGNWQKFSVKIGENLTANQVNLIFIMDNDSGSGANSSFRNIKFIER